MGYKTVVLHLTHLDVVKRQISAASELVAAKGGHVKGVFVMPPMPLPVEFVFPASEEYLRDLYAEYQTIADGLEAEFHRLADKRHFESEWSFVEGIRTTVADGFINEARASDLALVVNRRIGGESLDIRAAPERIILETGRPVFVLPEEGQAEFKCARVTIAWANRAEAARAVFDALPLLSKASHIRILTIEESKRSEKQPKGLEGADIAAVLSRHGLNVDVATVSASGQPVGEVLLDEVASDGADVLVMGGYGHSRLREMVLGGATRHILDAAKIPVLISH